MTDYPDCKEIYSDLREKWKHEDDLINQRMTWLLNSQAFLLAAYGVLAKLRMETKLPASSTWFERITTPFSLAEFALPCVTLFTLYFLGKGIYAAIRAMSTLKQELREHQAAGRLWAKITVDVLPDTTEDGAAAPKRLVVAFVVVWTAILVFEVHGLWGR